MGLKSGMRSLVLLGVVMASAGSHALPKDWSFLQVSGESFNPAAYFFDEQENELDLLTRVEGEILTAEYDEIAFEIVEAKKLDRFRYEHGAIRVKITLENGRVIEAANPTGPDVSADNLRAAESALRAKADACGQGERKVSILRRPADRVLKRDRSGNVAEKKSDKIAAELSGRLGFQIACSTEASVRARVNAEIDRINQIGNGVRGLIDAFRRPPTW